MRRNPFALTLFFIAFFITSAFVHFEGQAQVSLGLKGGVGSSTVLFDPDNGLRQNFTNGLVGGLVVKQVSKPNVGLLAEINFSQRGWTQAFLATETIPERTAQFRYNYIELPIMTHIFLGNRRVRYFLNVGPQFSYLLSTSSAIDILESDSIFYEYDENTAVNFEYGVTLGGGISVEIGNGVLQAEGRLVQGLNNIIDREADDAPVGSLNQVIQISVSYLFHIGGKKWQPKKKIADPPPEADAPGNQ